MSIMSTMGIGIIILLVFIEYRRGYIASGAWPYIKAKTASSSVSEITVKSMHVCGSQNVVLPIPIPNLCDGTTKIKIFYIILAPKACSHIGNALGDSWPAPPRLIS